MIYEKQGNQKIYKKRGHPFRGSSTEEGYQGWLRKNSLWRGCWSCKRPFLPRIAITEKKVSEKKNWMIFNRKYP